MKTCPVGVIKTAKSEPKKPSSWAPTQEQKSARAASVAAAAMLGGMRDFSHSGRTGDSLSTGSPARVPGSAAAWCSVCKATQTKVALTKQKGEPQRGHKKVRSRPKTATGVLKVHFLRLKLNVSHKECSKRKAGS